MRLEAGDDFGVVVGAGAAFGDYELVRKAEVGCGLEAAGVGDVGDDYGYFGAGETAFADGVGDGEEVGASAGEEDGQAVSFVGGVQDIPQGLNRLR